MLKQNLKSLIRIFLTTSYLAIFYRGKSQRNMNDKFKPVMDKVQTADLQCFLKGLSNFTRKPKFITIDTSNLQKIVWIKFRYMD